MARFLHLVKADSPSLAGSVIDANARESGAHVTVILLHGATPPALPPTVEIHRLAPDDLDYSAVLDLIFQSDHVVAW